MNLPETAFARLVRREFTTKRTIEGIRAKIGRLQVAVDARTQSLNNIQREIAELVKAQPIAVENERTNR